VHLVLTERFPIELLRAEFEEFCVIFQVMEVTSFFGGCEAAQLHVLNKPLAYGVIQDPSERNSGYCE
jgi:hypothetical protein